MKELTLEITNKCHVECPWCSSGSTPDGKSTPLEDALGYLDGFKSECDVVRISGGEPTLHFDLAAVCAHASKLRYKVLLLTSGREMNEILNWGFVDEYVLNVVDEKSILEVLVLKAMKKSVSMHAVLAKGNGEWVSRAVNTSLLYSIPVRLLTLQKQGRGADCEPLGLIRWTGDRGCDKENKVTVTHDGKVVTCSALKYRDACDARGTR